MVVENEKMAYNVLNNIIYGEYRKAEIQSAQKTKETIQSEFLAIKIREEYKKSLRSSNTNISYEEIASIFNTRSKFVESILGPDPNNKEKNKD